MLRDRVYTTWLVVGDDENYKQISWYHSCNVVVVVVVVNNNNNNNNNNNKLILRKLEIICSNI